jgi:hypothetical protein
MKIVAFFVSGLVVFLAPVGVFYISRGYFPHSIGEFFEFIF